MKRHHYVAIVRLSIALFAIIAAQGCGPVTTTYACTCTQTCPRDSGDEVRTQNVDVCAADAVTAQSGARADGIDSAFIVQCPAATDACTCSDSGASC